MSRERIVRDAAASIAIDEEVDGQKKPSTPKTVMAEFRWLEETSYTFHLANGSKVKGRVVYSFPYVVVLLDGEDALLVLREWIFAEELP